MYLNCSFSSWQARWAHGWCAQLRAERSGFEPWPGTLSCVLIQDTLLSQCFSPPRCINGYRQIVRENLTNWGEVTCDGLTSRLGEVKILPAASCYRNRDKLRQLWAPRLHTLPDMDNCFLMMNNQIQFICILIAPSVPNLALFICDRE